MTPLASNPEKPIRPPGLVAMPEILNRGQWSRSFTYVLLKKGLFTQPVIRSARIARWSLADIDEYFLDPVAWEEKNAAEQVPS